MASIRKFDLTLSQAKLICKKKKLIEPKKINRFEKGMINDVFLLDDRYVIKVNTGHPELPKLKKEKELYELLRKRNIPVPKVYSYDSSKSIIDYSYIIMEKIEGNSLNDIWDSMKKDVKFEQLSQIGEILAKIHSITFDNFGEEFSNGKFKGQKIYKEFIKKYTNSLANELEKSAVLDRNKINSIKDYFQKSKAFNINPKASLLHGNFNYDNVLVENKKIKGIVDWEWGKSMHNEEEVSTFIYRVLKEEKNLVKEFRKGYEKILKLDKSFDERYKAYNLLYYLRVLPSVPAWTHRPDKQKEYYDEVDSLYYKVIGKKMTRETSEKSMKNESAIYIYATEMINEYYSRLIIKEKKVLTICGSGDQVLNALFLGAKKTTGFDLNIYSKHMLILKIASILSLNLKDFLKFFGDKKINIGFDYKIYIRIRENLNNLTKIFFDDLYKEFNFNGEKLAKSDYFRERARVQERGVKEFNLYLKNEKTYLKMKKILKEQRFNFVLGSVLDIPLLIKYGKYDIINLSNVQNYVCLNLNEKETVKCFYEKVLLPLSNLLNEEGIIFYYTRDEGSYPNSFRKEPPTLTKEENIKLLSGFKKFKVEQKSFRSFTKGQKDKIVIFRKKA